MGIWSQVKALFGEAEQSTKNFPVVHELLTRHKDEAEQYERWRSNLIAQQLRTWLGTQYAVYLTDQGRVDQAIDFLDTPSKKGFVIHFGDTRYTRQEAEMLQLFLRERVMEHRYRTQVADSKTYAFTDGTEHSDRYYLKPKPDWQPPKDHVGGMNTHTADQFNQQFGNIMIELIVRNDKPWQLQFSATIYHDRVYQDPKGFGALMDILLVEK